MKKQIITSLVALSLSLSAFAQIKDADMLKKIQKTYPKLNVSAAIYLPEIKLFEVRIKDDNNLSYTNENIDFFLINGSIINPKTQENVSTTRNMEYVKDFLRSLPFEKSIEIKYGNINSKTRRRIAVFTDPDCQFCKATDKLIAAEMKKDDITFNYFFNPLNIPGHELAPEKARKIWCSPNKVSAYKNWMENSILPDNNGTCKNPIQETKAIAVKNDFNSTPTLVFDNGFIWKGAITPAQIRELLQAKK